MSHDHVHPIFRPLLAFFGGESPSETSSHNGLMCGAGQCDKVPRTSSPGHGYLAHRGAKNMQGVSDADSVPDRPSNTVTQPAPPQAVVKDGRSSRMRYADWERQRVIDQGNRMRSLYRELLE